MAAGFTGRQIPSWVGSEPVTSAPVDNAVLTKTTPDLTRTGVAAVKPAGNQPPEGRIPPNRRLLCLMCLLCLFVVFVVSDVIEHAEIVGQLFVREDYEPKINTTA
jgi:hypothetical protein